MFQGECLGTAYVEGHGLYYVYQDVDNTQMLILINGGGERRLMRRELVQWRRSPAKTSTQTAGYRTPKSA